MRSLLRERDGHHAHVGFVELFFDLVFVFAITQISHTLLEHLSWLGALQAAMMLMAVWWAWNFTSWVTNWLDPERTPVRVALFALMAAGLVMSTSLPEAFGAKGLPFAIAFVCIQVGRTLFMLLACRKDAMLRQNFTRILIWMSAAGVLWITGGLAEPEQRLWWWLGALFVEYVSPALYFYVPGLGRAATSDWNVEGGHLAERVGLFVIICLGESILVTGATFAGLAWTWPATAAFVAALFGAIAMWWLYFDRKHEAASEVISRSEDPGALARRAYTYSPILVVAGIVVTAVGDELSMAHPLGHLSTETAMVLIGGPFLFLAGTSVAVFAVWGRLQWTRVVGAAALLALWPALPLLTPVALTVTATVILVAVAAWETLSPGRKTG